MLAPVLRPLGNLNLLVFFVGLVTFLDRHDLTSKKKSAHERFLEYVKEVLVPTLAPGDLVVIDNLSSHKSHPVREAIEAAGARLLFLPRYSPDFNPIEKAFAKLKALLRKAAERTVSGVRQAIRRILAGITPTECANFFASAGYEPS